MAEYIEREKAKQRLVHDYAYAAANILDEIPAADVVEVVRCKDCRMFVDNKSALTTYCTRECKNLTVKPDDFCSYGERKCEE